MAWDNLDGAVAGSTVREDFDVQVADDGHIELTAADLNTAETGGDSTTWYSAILKDAYGTLAELNLDFADSGLFDKISVFATYDDTMADNTPTSAMDDPVSLFGTPSTWQLVADTDDPTSRTTGEHLALSNLVRLMASDLSAHPRRRRQLRGRRWARAPPERAAARHLRRTGLRGVRGGTTSCSTSTPSSRPCRSGGTTSSATRSRSTTARSSPTTARSSATTSTSSRRRRPTATIGRRSATRSCSSQAGKTPPIPSTPRRATPRRGKTPTATALPPSSRAPAKPSSPSTAGTSPTRRSCASTARPSRRRSRSRSSGAPAATGGPRSATSSSTAR